MGRFADEASEQISKLLQKIQDTMLREIDSPETGWYYVQNRMGRYNIGGWEVITYQDYQLGNTDTKLPELTINTAKSQAATGNKRYIAEKKREIETLRRFVSERNEMIVNWTVKPLKEMERN